MGLHLQRQVHLVPAHLLAVEVGSPEALAFILGRPDVGEVEGELPVTLLVSLQPLVVHNVPGDFVDQLTPPILETNLNRFNDRQKAYHRKNIYRFRVLSEDVISANLCIHFSLFRGNILLPRRPPGE